MFRNYILTIVDIFLIHCSQSYDASVGLSIGSFIANNVQDLLSLGIILIYVVPNDVQPPNIARIANVIIMAVIVILFIPFNVVDSLYLYGGSEDYSLFFSISTAALNLAAAYFFLLLCAATYSACILLFYQYKKGQGSNSIVIQVLKIKPISPCYNLAVFTDHLDQK
jgi:hypothetical protein